MTVFVPSGGLSSQIREEVYRERPVRGEIEFHSFCSVVGETGLSTRPVVVGFVPHRRG